jgi:hypothetical protein
MSDIHVGDMLYDCEAEGNLIGWVVEMNDTVAWWDVQWNDGSRIQTPSNIVRNLKKEWHKLRKKCLTKKKK